MKHFLIGLISVIGLTVATPAMSQHHHGLRHHHFHNHHRHWNHPHNWVVPAIIGGAVVYAATRPETVIIQNPPVVNQPQTVVIDGVVYTKQVMIINGVQTEVLVKN
jgi:hypothetical protein